MFSFLFTNSMEIEVYLSIEVNVDPMTSTKPEKSDISSLEKSCFWLISWLRLKFKPSQVKPKLKKKSQKRYLIGGKWRKFWGGDKIFPRHFITRPKLLPDFFIPDRNFYAIFYTPTKTQIQIFYAFINRIMLYTSNYQIYFQASEGN